MKRSLPSVIVGAVLVATLALYMITYQVRFNEVAVIRTFGKIAEPDPVTGKSPDVITQPGLKWKWPWPIQRVITYDNRLQFTQTTGEETPTRDAKNVIVTTAIGWRIGDPYTFSIINTSMADAEEKLKTRVRNDQKTVIADYDFVNLISTDPNELKYDQMESRIFEVVEPSAAELYGIRVEYLGIERLALPKRITADVFNAMKQERKAQAARYTSEGKSEAARIKAKAESIADTILTFADRKADEIVAEGKRQSAQYNITFRQDESLAIFLLEIDYLLEILKERATIILDGTKPPFDLLRTSGEVAEAPPSVKEVKIDRSAVGVAPPDMVQPK